MPVIPELACLECQYSGGRGRKITSLRTAWAIKRQKECEKAAQGIEKIL